MGEREETEAIKNIVKSMIFCGLCTTGNCKECIKKKAKDFTLEAIEKQIPKEPIYKPSNELYQRAHCPACKKKIYAWNLQAAHCNCGQRLKTELL